MIAAYKAMGTTAITKVPMWRKCAQLQSSSGGEKRLAAQLRDTLRWKASHVGQDLCESLDMRC
ncbi:hypothetical protein Cst04h_17990 [Corynebacterium striatum]|uniref:Uncharacterized protein n=1 Tax=Corynebacterium striatum TaxID=43770 RepID=A0ABC9ZNK2_CORST|nr:hypothetical protein Cst04h_17990 [Corynebacterium striatum]